MLGNYCRLERVDVRRHGLDLWDAFAGEPSPWTYMPFGPFETYDQFQEVLRTYERWEGLRGFAIIMPDGRASGLAAWLRFAPGDGSIEVGAIVYSSRLKRTRAATEAMHLMARSVFQSGFRRYEWKCDALNRPSRLAAERLGFVYEGTFRQATVYKGRNRDTAWYSIVDADWGKVGSAMERWLEPSNFDEAGLQRRSLGAMRQELQ
jgi:RimJ/RimL family protein N-acetyltransferase